VFREVGQKKPLMGPLARVLLRVGVLGVLLTVTFALWLITSPLPWTLLAKRLVRDLPGSLVVQDIDLTGPGNFWEPETWEFTLVGLHWTPDDPEGPVFHLDRLVSPLPDWEEWSNTRELHVPWVRIIGLDLHVPTQRPPPPWERSDNPLSIRIDRVWVWDASFQVDATDSQPGISAGAIYGELKDVRIRPGTRDFSGTGHARIGSLQYGDMPFTGATIGTIVADEQGVLLENAAFGLAAGEGLATLRFEGLLKTATTLTLEADVTSLRLQDIVAATSDRPSPVRGRVSATAQLKTDPTAARGSAILSANVQIPALVIPFDVNMATTGPLLRAMLELFGYQSGDGLNIKSLTGPIRLGQGWIELDGLRSTVLGVAIELRSRIDQNGVWILVRRLPRLRNLGRLTRTTGSVGLVIEGHHDALWLRTANETEMKAGRRVGPFKNEGVRLSD
jgi:hypothetical protein